MSLRPESLSPDLQRLEDEGYGLHFRAGYLLVAVPYANAKREVAWGYLVSALELAGNQTNPPDIHVAHFQGATVDDFPCDSQGNKLTALMHEEQPRDFGEGLIVTCGFSQRPTDGRTDYRDYFEKMSTYVGMLQAEAQAIDPSVTYKNFPPVATGESESVFRYLDSATARAEIGAVVDHIRDQRIAIIGVGGTGSYILDAVAKTPVAEIHLFDGDVMLTHNAFRAPGAATLDELNRRPLKANFHQVHYDAMHRHVVAHPDAIDEETVDMLADYSFVFVSIDAGPIKLAIFEFLQAIGTPFVDVGMGLFQAESAIGGNIRTSLSTPRQSDPAWLNAEISIEEDRPDDYDQSIQIAELNMLNAAFAVIAWKKYFGFYLDFDRERESIYTIDGNFLVNEKAA